MAIKLNGSTSGSVALDAPADTSPSGTDVTLTLPTSAGSSGQYLQTNGSGTLSWQTVTDTGATWTTLSSQSLASSGAVSVTGIPSTATRVMVSFTNVKTATNNEWGIRAGTSSGLASSGYDTIGGYWGGSNGGTQINDRWACYGSASTGFDWNGQIIIYKMSGNLWQGFAWYHYNSGGTSRFAHGEVSLGGTLDRIGFTGLGANFNSGTIYPSYMEP